MAQKGIPLPHAYTNPKADNVIFGNDFGKDRYITSKQATDRVAGDVTSEYRRAVVKTNLRESRTRSMERRRSTLGGSISLKSDALCSQVNQTEYSSHRNFSKAEQVSARERVAYARNGDWDKQLENSINQKRAVGDKFKFTEPKFLGKIGDLG